MKLPLKQNLRKKEKRIISQTILSLVYTINIFKKVEEEFKYLVECNATFLKEEREVAIFELKMILVDEQRGTKCYSIQIP